MRGYKSHSSIEGHVYCLIRNRKYAVALKLIKTEKNPTAKLLLNKAFCLLKKGYTTEALEIYSELGDRREAHDLAVPNAQFKITLEQNTKIMKAARNFQSCNMHRQAIQKIKELDACLINKEALIILIDSYLSRRESKLAMYSAVEAVNDLLKQFPDDKECLKKACEVAVLNESENAIALLKRAAKELTHPEDFLLSMVDLFIGINSLALAIDASKVILERFPENQQNYLKLIKCFLLSKEIAQALKYILISNKKFVNDLTFLQESRQLKSLFPSVLTNGIILSNSFSSFYKNGIHLAKDDIDHKKVIHESNRGFEALDLETSNAFPAKKIG